MPRDLRYRHFVGAERRSIPWPRAISAALLVATLAAAPASADWGARKKPSADVETKARKTKPKAKRDPGAKAKRRAGHKATPTKARRAPNAQPTPGRSGPASAPGRVVDGAGAANDALGAAVDAALAGARPVSALLPLLRKAVARREMSLALRIADAVAARARVSAGDLVDVASALGQGQAYPVQAALWARAYRAGRVPSYLRATIEEGYADALLAAQRYDDAERVLFAALKRRRAGERGPIIERMVAWAKVADRVDLVRDTLLALRDPDAAIEVSRIVGAHEGEAAATSILREAFGRFPGHRRLSAAYRDVLARSGARAELERVIARVVALAPRDPMPWLQLLDAHIVVRDTKAARALIDRLLARYPRDDVLVEALVDREQRVGDAPERLDRLYRALIAAGPDNPAYVEAYAEWMLTPPRSDLAAAFKILAALERMSHGRAEGLRRKAALLAAQGHTGHARQVLSELERAYPGRRDTLRAVALLDGSDGRRRAAEQAWLRLVVVPSDASPELRRDIAEARRSLLGLWRREGVLFDELRRLADAARAGKLDLGGALVLLDGVLSEDDQATRALLDEALLASGGPLAAHWRDGELLARVGALRAVAGHFSAALEVVVALRPLDREAASELAMRVVERALALADHASAAAAEALLDDEDIAVATLLRLGELHARSGDSEGARRLLRRAAARAPRDTRPTARLARLFRESGDLAAEDDALRAVVVRTTDADELEAAGQRLLTLAMARGRSGELLRWLDAVTPTHPRKPMIQRFRMLAYDAWTRTEPLERRLRGAPEPDPGGTLFLDGLANGDLAVRVRALRQARWQRRPLPPALARRLLADSSMTVRHDTVLALAAAGDKDSVALLLELEAEHGVNIISAIVLAFGRLPPVPAAVGQLADRLRARNHREGALVALVLGHIADPAALAPLIDALARRRDLTHPVLMALGPVLRHCPDGELSDRAYAALIDALDPDPTMVPTIRQFQAAVAMWALAASASPRGRAALLGAATSTPSALLRRVALRLLAAKAPPTIDQAFFDVDTSWHAHGSLGETVMRALLTPWLRPDAQVDSDALGALDAVLADALRDSGRYERDNFCSDLAAHAAENGQIAALCGARRAGSEPAPAR